MASYDPVTGNPLPGAPPPTSRTPGPVDTSTPVKADRRVSEDEMSFNISLDNPPSEVPAHIMEADSQEEDNVTEENLQKVEALSIIFKL